MKIQKCVDYSFSETRIFRTALPIEFLYFIIDNIEKHAYKKGDIRRLFYIKYGLLLDRIQVTSVFSYLLSKGFIAIRNIDAWAKGTDKQCIIRIGGLYTVFYCPLKEHVEVIKNKIKKAVENEPKLTNCLSFSYLGGMSHEDV